MACISSLAAPRRLIIALAIAAVTLVVAGCRIELPLPYPSYAKYRVLEQKPSEDGPVTVRFMGVTSLLLQDSATSILSDGFISRPGEARVLLGRISPNQELIDSTIGRLGMQKLAAVFCGHSHYDHCLDAPVFAQRTGAILLGSPSTENLGRGYGLRPSQLYVVRDGEMRRFGGFDLTFLHAEHSIPDRVRGTIARDVEPPARKSAWKTGEVYSVHVRHGNRTLLVHGSANFKRHALRRCQAEVVYLGIWGLGGQTDQEISNFWDEVVVATGAKRVIPVHWDFFFRGLEDGLRPFPTPLASFESSMQHVLRLAAEDGVEVVMPVLWLPTDPFAGLAEPVVLDPSRPLCTRNGGPA
jgi:L-ascorbate metabolism protein UlaG (beta-lactamase superfamily)